MVRLSNFIKTHAIQLQIAAALLSLFIALATIVATTLTELNARRHDYIILNLTGQMRVLSEVMLRQSENYMANAARDYTAYDRDLKFFNQDLFQAIKEYDAIVTGLESRSLSAELTGTVDEVLVCTWDEQSRSQMGQAAAHWAFFKNGLLKALGPDQDAPRLEYAAQYIVKQGPALVNSAHKLAMAFQIMMEGKLASIKRLNQMGMALALLIALLVLGLLYLRAFRPINQTIQGFQRVALGDLEHRLPVATDNEVGQLRKAFNGLTQRLDTFFRLTQRIHQADNIDTTLRFVYEEFRPLLPLDWVGLLRPSVDGNNLLIERLYGAHSSSLYEGLQLPWDPLASHLWQGLEPSVYDPALSDAPLLQLLQQHDLRSAIFLPLQSQAESRPVMVFASTLEQAYGDQHREILANISSQIAISLDKTQGMESLVVSAIEGLAKLAESRDPETGDHLLRMSLYSAVITEELAGHTEEESIDHQYVRDLFRFAPMHDIGKVGVKDHILLKPAALDDDERFEMQRHPIIGAEVLRRCEQQVARAGHSIFRLGIEIAEAHHEKFDGSGYPYGLIAQAIPLSARIVAAADVFDALTSKRPYKEAWSVEQALQHMLGESGKHFDPQVIAALQRGLPRIMEIYTRHKHV